MANPDDDHVHEDTSGEGIPAADTEAKKAAAEMTRTEIMVVRRARSQALKMI